MDILQVAYQLGANFGSHTQTHCSNHTIYHYRILLKYRFEDDLQATLNRVLELTASGKHGPETQY